MAPEARKRVVREGQRDVTTLLVGAVVTLVSKVMEIEDPEAVGALTTILVILCHRAVPDMASHGGR